jgi:FtsP/CotA-like multicopper oxidase with cupredoxin domain
LVGFLVVLICVAALPAIAQSFRVQCPTSTLTHPAASNDVEPAYTGATTLAPGANGYLVPGANVNGAIKCQQVSGGDGYATMGDGTQTYLFGFGPLSGLADVAQGKPGTQFPNVFNTLYPGATPLVPGDPATTVDPGGLANQSTAKLNLDAIFTSFGYNGAVGLDYDRDIGPTVIDGHVDPRPMLDVGVMNANIPAPLLAIDEDDEFFLTLSNVGMIMRPDLFEQHTIHFHGYPNASSIYDGVPDASVAINIGGSFTYYYLAPDAGTYFWHCHISPPEHLQMGMVGQLYVRPRQNRVPVGNGLYAALQAQQQDLRTACNSATDILCSNPLPATANSLAQKVDDFAVTDPRIPANTPVKYAYNDGDGSTAYDVEYPLQIHGFDPNFHFVGMTFNPEGFADMKDKYFLLNGRSYPDTVNPNPLETSSADGSNHFSQPLPSIINIKSGEKALLRISDLDVTEYQTLASLGIPMKVIGMNAKLLRDQAGNNMFYNTNSITLAGGESVDVILDSLNIPVGTYYLYTPNLDHLSNDAENFGGLMTEVRVN